MQRKWFRYAAEVLLLVPVFGMLALLPLDAASALGGTIGRRFGPLTAWHRRAVRNLARIIPERTAEHPRILQEMWDNLGRTFAEYPHLSRTPMGARIRVTGLEHLESVRASGQSFLFVSGHFANWEIMPRAASDRGFPLLLVYRPANNPVMEWLLRRIRAAYHRGMVAKEGAMRHVMRAVREGRPIGMLIDQKFNQGISVPFCGHEAMTSPAVAELAIKHALPILPARIVREEGAHFTVHIFPPLVVASEEEPLTAERVLNRMHAMLEEWIHAAPGQWLWIHNRWPRHGREMPS